MALQPAAAVEAAAIDGKLDLVGIGAVAHPIAALCVHDVHVDPRRLVDLAGDPDDRLRPRLADRLGIGLGEGDVPRVDQQAPERLGADRVVRRGRRPGIRHASGEQRGDGQGE